VINKRIKQKINFYYLKKQQNIFSIKMNPSITNLSSSDLVKFMLKNIPCFTDLFMDIIISQYILVA